MSLRTEEVYRENEAGTESARHSPGGHIVPECVRRDPAIEPGKPYGTLERRLHR